MTTSKSCKQRLGLVSIALMSICFLPQIVSAQDDPATRGSFVDNFDTLDKRRWFISDGWNNGKHQNCTWSSKQVTQADGKLTLEFAKRRFKDRDHVCAEIQTLFAALSDPLS